MTVRLLLCSLLFPLLAACQFRPPAIPYADVPAAPLAQELERLRRDYPGVKALARVETARKGRVRAYESVAVLQRGLEKFRIEAFGPLGAPLFILVWDGASLAARSPGRPGLTPLGNDALERMLGMAFAPADLAAILSGNAPAAPPAGPAGCSGDGRCVVDLAADGGTWRIHGLKADGGPLRVDALERYQGGTLAFFVRYEGRGGAGGPAFPKRVIVERPSAAMSLRVEYGEAEVTDVVDDSAFATGGEAAP